MPGCMYVCMFFSIFMTIDVCMGKDIEFSFTTFTLVKKIRYFSAEAPHSSQKERKKNPMTMKTLKHQIIIERSNCLVVALFTLLLFVFTGRVGLTY